jgi:hypothetical protein
MNDPRGMLRVLTLPVNGVRNARVIWGSSPTTKMRFFLIIDLSGYSPRSGLVRVKPVRGGAPTTLGGFLASIFPAKLME